MADVLTKQKTAAVSSAVDWDTTKVSSPADSLYASGKTRMLRVEFTIRTAASTGNVTIGTIADGHRPAVDYRYIARVGDELKAMSFGADGTIYITAPSAKTYIACITYLVS